MQFKNHGGGCCGIRHIHGMGDRAEMTNSAYFLGVPLEGMSQGNHRFRGPECLDALLERFWNEHDREEGRLVEVILTDLQERSWRQVLEDRDFRKVIRFQNDNTGNWCNIYHYYPDWTRYQLGEINHVPAAPPAPAPQPAQARPVVRLGDPLRTYVIRQMHDDGSVNTVGGGILQLITQEELADLREQARRQNPPPPPVAHLFSTYHCEYRGGRRGAGYDSREAAQTANPRARTIVEKRYYSDGTTDWNVAQ